MSAVGEPPHEVTVGGRPAEPDPGLSGRRVLAVDEDPRCLELVRGALEPRGLDVLTASGRAAAQELLARNPTIDLVLVDVSPPGLDGLRTIQDIRSRRCFRALPVVALTELPVQTAQQVCMAAGANDLLAKPVDSARLLFVLRVWLRRY